MIWVIAQLHWLAWAYLLEFQGYSVHLEVWIASLLVLVANVYLMSTCISCSRTWYFSKAVSTTQSHQKFS